MEAPPPTQPRPTLLAPLLLGFVPFWYQAARTHYPASLFGFQPNHFSVGMLLTPVLALALTRWRPSLAIPAVAIPIAAIEIVYGTTIGTLLLGLALAPIYLWALAGRAIVLPWARLEDTRAMRVAYVPLTGLGLILVANPGVPKFRLTMPFVGLAVGLAGATILVPRFRVAAIRATDAWCQPFGRVGVTGRRPLPGRVGDAARVVDRAAPVLVAALRSVRHWFAVPRPDRALVPLADEPMDRRARAQSYATPVGAFVLLTYVMNKIQLRASLYWTHGGTGRFTWHTTFTDATGKIGWGSGDYWAIADHGYRRSEYREAAFPLYSLVVRWLSPLWRHDLLRTEVRVSTVSGLAATVLLWTWMLRRGVPRRTRRVALALFLLYPYSFMLLGIAYNDAFLLPFVIGAFILIESDHPVWAGVVAGLATFTRPNALPLILGLVVYVVARNGVLTRRTPEQAERPHLPLVRRASDWIGTIEFHPRRLRPAHFGVLLSISGVAGFSYWMDRHAGDPLYWLTVQARYGHRPVTAPSTWLKVEFINTPWTFMNDHGVEANHVLALACIIGGLIGIGAVVRRFGWGQGAFAIALMAQAWVAPNGFAPAGRYLLPMLPAYSIVGAEALENRPRILRPLLVGFAGLSITLTVLFARSGHWLEW